MAACLAELEIGDGVEPLLVEDERMEPVMIRHKCGKGEVYLLTTWNYPGALDQDKGPSAELHSPGIIGYVLRSLASRARGTIFITDDGIMPARECEHVMYSYFPQDHSVCLMNIDFDHSHTFYLHLPDGVRETTLTPSEFRRFKLPCRSGVS